MRKILRFSVIACALISFSAALLAQTPAQRSFRFTYAFTVRDVPQGKPVNIWFPMAVSDRWQDVKVVSQSGDLPLHSSADKQYGDAIFHAESPKAGRPEYHFEVVYEVTRRERIGYSNGSFIAPAAPTSKPVLVRFSQADVLVPIHGRLADLASEQVKASNAVTPIQKARALYDYVFSTMRYDKSGTGWGHGDSEWACDSHHGNCTDFHSLFASMARSQGIPTRFAIGFSIPTDKPSGTIPGYHCWADFYADRHWVPVDISEAWKAQQKKDYYFGTHDDNRVQFSVGRDIVLIPAQKGKPLNYFVYPYVEVEGAEFINVRNEFAFAESSLSAKTVAISSSKAGN
jgi:transglutaminase-like putative cysteine protease